MLLLRTALVICLTVVPHAAGAALVTYYNFNSYDGNSSSIDSSNGNGSLTLQANGGSWPANELSNPSGTTVNALGGDPAGTALSLGNAGSDTGVRTLTFGFSAAGFKDLVLSYAGTAPQSAYSSAHVDYSINGTDFFDGGITYDPADAGSFKMITQDLSSIIGLNNQATAFLRLTLSGPNLNDIQNLVIDNLQINGTGTPETSATSMMAIAVVLFGCVAWRRRAASSPFSLSL